MEIKRRNPYPRPWRKRLDKMLEMAFKTAILLLMPTPMTLVISCLWYYRIFLGNIHLTTGDTETAKVVLIPLFGLIYSLFVVVFGTKVYEEFKAIRAANSLARIDEFMHLIGEELSAIIHIVMIVLSWIILITVGLLKYDMGIFGLFSVTTVAYVFGLLFFVLREMDDPLSGIWFIKNVRKELLEIDREEWHAAKREEARRGAMRLKDLASKYRAHQRKRLATEDAKPNGADPSTEQFVDRLMN